MKKLASIYFSLLMIISIMFSLPMAVDAEEAESFQIKIVHTNDIHARVTENEKSGIIGVAKLKSMIDDYTLDADMSLILDSGDTFHGQSIATLVQGESIAELLNACGYDAMTAGNHDWSYGKNRLKELSDMADVKMLVGNVIQSDGSQFFNDEFLIKEVTENGKTVKVGVFGVIDPKIYKSTTPSNVAGLTFTDSAEYAAEAASELKNAGCDIVIALSHTYDPADFAAKVNGVDLWLCGHEHLDINTSVTTPNGKTAYVMEDGYYLGQVGLISLDCTFDESGKLDSFTCEKTAYTYADTTAYENDGEIEALLDEINQEQSVILNQTVGYSPAMLDGVWEHLRIDETNLGKAVANAYLLVTGADVAFENAGGIRASIEAGDVTYGNIIGVSPYGNYIVTKQVNGKQLKEILETSIDIQVQCIAANDSGDYNAWPQSSGSYLQTAGMTVTYNPALEKGSRVISVKIGGTPLDESRMYTVATNNYVAVSSYYPQLTNAAETGEYCACDEALIQFFKQENHIIAASISEKGMIKTTKTTADIIEIEPKPSDTTSDDVEETEPKPSDTTSENDSDTQISNNTDNPKETTTSNGSEQITSPQTGDNSSWQIYCVMLFLSSAVVAALIKMRKA